MADAAALAPTAAVEVLEVAPPRTKILTFACEIPADMSFVPADPDSIRKPLPPMANSVASPSQHQQEKGIVGTITFLGEKSGSAGALCFSLRTPTTKTRKRMRWLVV